MSAYTSGECESPIHFSKSSESLSSEYRRFFFAFLACAPSPPLSRTCGLVFCSEHLLLDGGMTDASRAHLRLLLELAGARAGGEGGRQSSSSFSCLGRLPRISSSPRGATRLLELPRVEELGPGTCGVEGGSARRSHPTILTVNAPPVSKGTMMGIGDILHFGGGGSGGRVRRYGSIMSSVIGWMLFLGELEVRRRLYAVVFNTHRLFSFSNSSSDVSRAFPFPLPPFPFPSGPRSVSPPGLKERMSVSVHVSTKTLTQYSHFLLPFLRHHCRSRCTIIDVFCWHGERVNRVEDHRWDDRAYGCGGMGWIDAT